MKRAVVTGLGFITSIGNNKGEVLDSLRHARTGIEYDPQLDRPGSPLRLSGTIKGFTFPRPQPDSWTMPPGLDIPRQQLRSLSPHALFAHAAMREAIADARMTPEWVSSPRTGMFCASEGSPWLFCEHYDRLFRDGVQRTSPFVVAAGFAGSLNYNLTPHFKILGASGGFVSACASSAQAFGVALDTIRLGRQDFMFVVGAEDCNPHSNLVMAACRATTQATDPALSPCAFDVKRDGFAVTGGATVLVLEEREHALARGVPIYAEAVGWGLASDGHDVMAPEPNGAGLTRALRLALEDAGLRADEIDYVNAHGTATLVGDRAELRAMKTVFGGGRVPWLGSTKSQTGHGLSLAGAMEAGFCCLAMKDGFVPASINITEPDPEADGLRLATTPVEEKPSRVLSNSSGFGGTNVVLAFARA